MENVTQINNTCAACHRLTPQRQTQSLLNVIAWMAQTVPLGSLTEYSQPVGDMIYVRSAPDCVNCASSPPFKCDDQVEREVVPVLQRMMASFTMQNVEIEAGLLSHAIEWLLPEVHLEAGNEFRCGAIVRHALIVANNLVCAAQPGADALGVKDHDLEALCEPCTRYLRQAFQPENGSDFSISALDLAVIHWLHQGVLGIHQFARNYEAPTTLACTNQPNTHSNRLITTGLIAAVFLLAGILSFNPILLSACLLSLGVWCYLWWKKPAPHPEQEESSALQWPINLRSAVENNQNSYTQLLGLFDNIDLLGSANSLFSGTYVFDCRRAASLLLHIHASPYGPALVKWIARKAARPETLPRLCETGEFLLQEPQPNSSGNPGLAITCLLTSELVYLFPDQGEDSLLWQLAAWQSENGPPVAEKDDSSALRKQGNGAPVAKKCFYGFPRLLRQLLHHAAVVEQDQHSWSIQEGRSIIRCRNLAIMLLARPSLLNPHWHLLQIRLLADGLRHGHSAVRFPSSSGCSLTDLCSRIEASYRAFSRTSQVTQGAPAKKNECDQVTAEAWEVIHMRDFLVSFGFLSSFLTSASSAMQKYIVCRAASVLDGLLNRQLLNVNVAPPQARTHTTAIGKVVIQDGAVKPNLSHTWTGVSLTKTIHPRPQHKLKNKHR